jgi:hypothetical protein
MGDTWELIYWPGIKGRGEYIRLMFEEAGVTYVDWAHKEGQCHAAPSECIEEQNGCIESYGYSRSSDIEAVTALMDEISSHAA